MIIDDSLRLFTALIVIVGSTRLVELRLSRQRRQALAARGARPVSEPHFRAMVLLHTGVLVGALIEAWVLRRPLWAPLAFTALSLVVASNLLRWWVIATLGPHWNAQIMDSTRLGVVSSGPFRFVRHPNYVAVFLELLALPLIHGAYVTALGGAALHIWVLYHRIRTEEATLLADPAYRASMAHKPRFLPLPRRAPAAEAGVEPS
jgi:methyltransferase